MKDIFRILLISLFSLTVISCSSSDSGSSTTDTTTTALVWDQGSWDSHNWQ